MTPFTLEMDVFQSWVNPTGHSFWVRGADKTQPCLGAQRSPPDLTWVVRLLYSMTRFWLNFSFLSPFSHWSTWTPGSSWVSGKRWYVSNSGVAWNDTFTCGKRNSNDRHIRRHRVQEIQNKHCSKARAHIFPLEPKGGCQQPNSHWNNAL